MQTSLTWSGRRRSSTGVLSHRKGEHPWGQYWWWHMMWDADRQEIMGPVSYLQSVSAGPARRRFAYPPATTHMFGKRNSWMWPRAKMGQTDTDGEKTPTGSPSDDTHRRTWENMSVHVYVCVRERCSHILTTCQQHFSWNKAWKIYMFWIQIE